MTSKSGKGIEQDTDHMEVHGILKFKHTNFMQLSWCKWYMLYCLYVVLKFHIKLYDPVVKINAAEMFVSR